MKTKLRNLRGHVNSKVIVFGCIFLFLAFSILCPIISMLARITPDGLNQVFSSRQFGSAAINSLTTALVAASISIILALAIAWAMERTDIRFKAFFSIAFVVPMLIPSISHAFGLVALLGANGLITTALGLKFTIYGFWGIVIGSIMYSFPIAFLMFSSILHYEDGMPYQAAEVLGIPRFRRFTGITLPFLKKTVISAFFAVFAMIVTDYGVPLMIGGDVTTLSVLMYNKAAAMLDYDTGSVIGAVLLVPAVIAFVVDLLNPENAEASFVSDTVELDKSPVSKAISYILCLVILACVLAPIVAFCVMVFETKYPVDPTFTLYHIEKTMGRGAGRFLSNSLTYAVLTALFGTFTAFASAYMTTRLKGGMGKALHLVSLTTMAIPGLVLGLSYVIFFHDQPIYGTLFIIVFVNSIHFFASPYLMMYNALNKVNPNLEAVGASLGVSRIRIIIDVIIPKVKYSLYEMAVYFFVNSMMTISAVAFLAPPSPKPLALMVTQFEAQLLMESAAFVSLLIFVINLAIKVIFYFVQRRKDKTA